MKNIFSSLVLASTITLSNLSAMTSQYITYENDIIKKFEDKTYIKSHKDMMLEMLEALKTSDYEFNSKVTTYLFKTNQEWIKSDSQLVGKNLALIASHLKEKKKSYKNIQRIFTKDKELKTLNITLQELLSNVLEMETKIQNLIDISYMGIEAKNIFPLIKNILEEKNINVETYWYSLNMEENKPLFIISKDIETYDIEKVSKLEYEITNELLNLAMKKKEFLQNLPKISNYNFDVINNNFFKRISFI